MESSNPNQTSTSPEFETFINPEILQFNDGDGALGFRTNGEKLILGPNSINKYARDFSSNVGGDMAIIKTESGNKYVFAGGLVINKDSGRFFKLPEEDVEVTVGKPCVIPGVGTTTGVKTVMLHYFKASASSDACQLDISSPFKAIVNLIEAIDNEHLRQ